MTDDTNRVELDQPAERAEVVRRDVGGDVIEQPADASVLDDLGLRRRGSHMAGPPVPQVFDVPLAPMEVRRG